MLVDHHNRRSRAQTEQLAAEKAKLCSEKIALEAVLESESEYICNKLHVQVRRLLGPPSLGLMRGETAHGMRGAGGKPCWQEKIKGHLGLLQLASFAALSCAKLSPVPLQIEQAGTDRVKLCKEKADLQKQVRCVRQGWAGEGRVVVPLVWAPCPVQCQPPTALLRCFSAQACSDGRPPPTTHARTHPRTHVRIHPPTA